MKYHPFTFSLPRKYKLYSPLVFLIFCQFQFAFAQITLSGKPRNLTAVFKAIEQQSKYVFLYDRDIVLMPAVDIRCQNCPIGDIIHLLETETNLEFKVSGEQILVKKKPVVKVEATPMTVAAQQDTLKGKVVDEQGRPVIGATLLIKGTKIGTSTDKTGMFKLIKPQKGQMLSISTVGYHPREVVVDDQKMLTLQLLTKAQEI